jgi:hypothetical protein
MFRSKKPFNYTMEDLLDFNDKTLGKELALYLRRKNFRLIPGYVKHDCKHIILGYDMDETGEAAMQFYFLGNRHYTVPVVMTTIFCFFLMPEHWKMFLQEFRKGRSSAPFPDIDPLIAVRMKTQDLRLQYLVTNNNHYERANRA